MSDSFILSPEARIKAESFILSPEARIKAESFILLMTTKTTPKLKPTTGYVLIEPVELEKKTASGLVLPDSHDEKSQRGKVIAIGGPQITDSGRKINPEFKIGDTVIYKKWGGDEVKLGISGKELIFVKFEDVLAIVK